MVTSPRGKRLQGLSMTVSMPPMEMMPQSWWRQLKGDAGNLLDYLAQNPDIGPGVIIEVQNPGEGWDIIIHTTNTTIDDSREVFVHRMNATGMYVAEILTKYRIGINCMIIVEDAYEF